MSTKNLGSSPLCQSVEVTAEYLVTAEHLGTVDVTAEYLGTPFRQAGCYSSHGVSGKSWLQQSVGLVQNK